MSGSNTMMPGYIYTSNGSTLTANPNAAVMTTQQTIPLNTLQYQTINTNGHASLAGSTVFRPAGKILMPATGNMMPILVNPVSNLTQLTQNQNIITTNPTTQIGTLNGTIVTRSVNNGLVLTPTSNIANVSGEPRRKVFYVKLPPKNEPKLEPKLEHRIISQPLVTQPLVTQSIVSQPLVTQPLISQPIHVPRQVTSLPVQQVAPPVIRPPPTPEPQISTPEPPPATMDDSAKEDETVIDIMINNVVCSFAVGCHLNLRKIAMKGKNVEYKRENGMVTMKIRNPSVTASIWSSGKITCTGSTADDQAKVASRKIARSLQKLGYPVQIKNYRVVNVLGTCTMPFAIKIAQFSQKHRREASYEPELHPGVTYRIASPKATLKIFSTGSITVTAPNVLNVQSAIEHIFPLVKEFSKHRSPDEAAEARKAQVRNSEEDALMEIDSPSW